MGITTCHRTPKIRCSRITYDRRDVEHAIRKGRIEKKLTQEPRGTRYRIEGPARDGRLMHVICRYNEDYSLIIITVYALEE